VRERERERENESQAFQTVEIFIHVKLEEIVSWCSEEMNSVVRQGQD
jgi:hypothetical protein